MHFDSVTIHWYSLFLSLSLCTTFCQCNNLNNNISDILNIYIKKLTGLRIHVSYTTPHRYQGVQTLLRLIIQRLIPIHQDLFTLFDIISSGMNLLNSIRYKPCPPPQHLVNHFGWPLLFFFLHIYRFIPRMKATEQCSSSNPEKSLKIFFILQIIFFLKYSVFVHNLSTHRYGNKTESGKGKQLLKDDLMTYMYMYNKKQVLGKSTPEQYTIVHRL